jgi:hypothetical protein
VRIVIAAFFLSISGQVLAGDQNYQCPRYFNSAVLGSENTNLRCHKWHKELVIGVIPDKINPENKDQDTLIINYTAKLSARIFKDVSLDYKFVSGGEVNFIFVWSDDIKEYMNSHPALIDRMLRTYGEQDKLLSGKINALRNDLGRIARCNSVSAAVDGDIVFSLILIQNDSDDVCVDRSIANALGVPTELNHTLDNEQKAVDAVHDLYLGDKNKDTSTK